MKLPDGYIIIFESNKKGTEVMVNEKELVMCKNCKYRNSIISKCRKHDDNFYCADGERDE